MQVSVRELKAHLSKYLHLVKTRGESVIVTSRDTAMAQLSPVPDATAPKLQQLAQQGVIRWNGKKPKGGGRGRKSRARPRPPGLLTTADDSLCEQLLNEKQGDAVKREFSHDWGNYIQVGVDQTFLQRASKLAEAFALRAYDSVHLAAADMLLKQSGMGVTFACFDRKLNHAAAVLGLPLTAGR